MSRDHQKSIAGRLAAAARVYRARMGAAVGPLGLHAGQEGVLNALSLHDGQAMSELADTLGVQPPTVTKMVARLAAQGYVQKRASKSDARQARVFLTKAGRGALQGLEALMDELEERALEGIDEKDRRRLRKLLRRIIRNLDGGEPAEEGEE